ncbi:5-hydroxyisourate hydrolase isoform X1 [Folsomia candida]|nr:5-hydroxyisourate hydrolase isoform X1 [Folsomia candida]
MSAKAQVRNSDKAKTRLQVIANHLALQNNKHSEKSEEKQQENMDNANPLTSHILDTSRGRPAAGVLVKLFKRGADGNWVFITEQSTNNDGRIGNLISGAQFTPAIYKLNFDTKSYFTSKGEKTFYPFIDVIFEIEKPEEHYHVPILLNAYGFSTYRGS